MKFDSKISTILAQNVSGQTVINCILGHNVNGQTTRNWCQNVFILPGTTSLQMSLISAQRTGQVFQKQKNILPKAFKNKLAKA